MDELDDIISDLVVKYGESYSLEGRIKALITERETKARIDELNHLEAIWDYGSADLIYFGDDNRELTREERIVELEKQGEGNNQP